MAKSISVELPISVERWAPGKFCMYLSGASFGWDGKEYSITFAKNGLVISRRGTAGRGELVVDIDPLLKQMIERLHAENLVDETKEEVES